MSATRRRIATAWPVVALVALVVVGALVLSGLSVDLQQAITIGLINLVVVIGLYIFIGNSGVLSFGHVSFMAVGAYVCGILTIPVIARPVIIPNVPGFIRDSDLNTVEGLLAGAAVAAVLGLIVAIPLSRLQGIAAGIALFAVLLIVNTFFTHWEPGTGGGGTLTRVPTNTSLNSALTWAVVAIVLAYAFQVSRWGLRLRAARDDEFAARSAGIDVVMLRRAAMVLSAFVTGIGGGLYAQYVGSFGADAFFLQATFLTLSMLVVGGINSLAGAVSGTAVITGLTYVLDRWVNGDPVGPVKVHLPAGSQEIAVAVLMLVILVLRPDGLTAGRELRWPLRRGAG